MCVFVSPVLIPSLTNGRVDHFHPTRYLSHLPVGTFLLHAAKKNNNAVKFVVPLKQNNLEGFINFFSFKKRPIICKLNIRGL